MEAAPVGWNPSLLRSSQLEARIFKNGLSMNPDGMLVLSGIQFIQLLKGGIE